MSWLVPRSELTPDQIRAIELGPAEHRVLTGGPGSGKTQILLHRARFLADRFRAGDDRFRIFVYTNVLKDYIRSALSLLRLPEDSVLTFDHWCRLYYEQHINSRLPWNTEGRQPDFAAVRRAVFDKIAAGQSSHPLYDFVLVDEAQDLDEEVFTFLTRIARHVTVCIDNKQQIYDRGATEAGVLRGLGLPKRNINLIGAFRVCPYLVEVAAPLIADPGERESFRQQKRTVQTERQTPLLYLARDFEDEKRMLLAMIRERQLVNDRIAVLFPQNRQLFGFAQSMVAAGIEVEVPRPRSGNSPYPTHDFNSSTPKLMAYHSAKGLTFDSVFLPRLIPGSFPAARGERIERLVFVALTRAAKWAYLSACAGSTLPLLEKLLPLEQTRQLTIKRGQPGASAPAPVLVAPRMQTANSLNFL